MHCIVMLWCFGRSLLIFCFPNRYTVPLKSIVSCRLSYRTLMTQILPPPTKLMELPYTQSDDPPDSTLSSLTAYSFPRFQIQVSLSWHLLLESLHLYMPGTKYRIFSRGMLNYWNMASPVTCDEEFSLPLLWFSLVTTLSSQEWKGTNRLSTNCLQDI